MLGGRAAEEVVYGSRTTGVENDIEQATGLARQMVTRWGMSDKLGMVQLTPRQNNWVGPAALGAKPYSEETAKLIDTEWRASSRSATKTPNACLANTEPASTPWLQRLFNGNRWTRRRYSR
jgi:ATP-dependent Zn protease